MATIRPVSAVASYAARTWDEAILPALTEYIRIPALSPAFDPDWAAHGRIAEAVRQFRAWAEARDLPGATVEVVELAGRTPVLLVDVPGTAGQAGPGADTVLLYGHLDKQPEMTGWREGLGPWTPVLDGERLYGRGGADDGYAMFAALTAIGAVRSIGGAHARCVVLVEASEESGSPDLPAYVEALAGRIGRPSLVVCLDSGCADYERLWATTSLRGMAGGVLRVEITREGLHSGSVGGVVPSTFRIARQLLDRIEDSGTGRVLLEEAHAAIPAERLEQVEATAAIVGDVSSGLPVVDGADVVAGRLPAEVLLDRTWRPALAVIGADGLPSSQAGGNVLRPMTALSLSLRLPPAADPERAAAGLAAALTADPPYGARVSFEAREAAPGWDAPPTAPWLATAASEASRAHFGHDAAYMGEGGTIPFMGMLGERFPEAQFLVVGVLGPGSNAHGPNEFLHVPMGERLTASVADVLTAHVAR
ncbi:MAG: M20/M25/M40 family metallo-hydrolase [Acidimicrobiia bacterium]|nr:M20/M25/M40 family metallo-hydrolase [Acidimicrobiia bacterium]